MSNSPQPGVVTIRSITIIGTIWSAIDFTAEARLCPGFFADLDHQRPTASGGLAGIGAGLA